DHPQPWILRNKKSMQNPVWPGQKPKILPQKTPIILRYRLILHQGKASPESMDQWYLTYSKLR
ncbi:MAG: PmoA family protein, partial [Verrucomicrobiota bacterium]|nr:PmoA family protein [Verrucomicrobiota bacterium]